MGTARQRNKKTTWMYDSMLSELEHGGALDFLRSWQTAWAGDLAMA